MDFLVFCHKQCQMLMLNMAEDSDTKVSLFQVFFSCSWVSMMSQRGDIPNMGT